MNIPENYRIPVALGAIVVLLAIGYGAYAIYDRIANPIPDNTVFYSSHFMFEYPREYRIEEYASGVVSVGRETEDGFQPLVEVVRYQNDRNARQPASYDAYLRAQLLSLCGGDEPNQFVACDEPTPIEYQSPTGFQGQRFDMTLFQNDLALGTTTPRIFGPIYTFNVTRENQEPPIRYSAIVVYPAVDAVKKGLETAELKEIIMRTLDLTPGGGA